MLLGIYANFFLFNIIYDRDKRIGWEICWFLLLEEQHYGESELQEFIVMVIVRGFGFFMSPSVLIEFLSFGQMIRLRSVEDANVKT